MSAERQAAGRRLDQWLWFARFAKSRAFAARLCAAGAVSVNGAAVRKPSHPVRIGDVVDLPQRGFRRSVRVRDVGTRRSPASEASLLYEAAGDPVRLSALEPAWVPLLHDALE